VLGFDLVETFHFFPGYVKQLGSRIFFRATTWCFTWQPQSRLDSACNVLTNRSWVLVVD